MAPRRSSRLVLVLAVAAVLLAGAPALAAPAAERGGSVPVLLQELWTAFSERLVGLLTAGDRQSKLRPSSASATYERAASEEPPLVEPQLGKDDDPNG